jgi:hypothetical protein
MVRGKHRTFLQSRQPAQKKAGQGRRSILIGSCNRPIIRSMTNEMSLHAQPAGVKLPKAGQTMKFGMCKIAWTT